MQPKSQNPHAFLEMIIKGVMGVVIRLRPDSLASSSQFWRRRLQELVIQVRSIFEIDETPSEAKVRIAAMHLEGKALQWHQVFMKGRISRDPPS